MNSNSLSEQQLVNCFVTALQTSAWGYPSYNMMTQMQNSFRAELLRDTKNPLNRFGQKYYSQNEEDGILLEILKRTELLSSPSSRRFIEFGVGNGLENNSLILLMHGFKGVWVGNEELAIDTSKSNKLKYIKTWLTLDNMAAVLEQSIEYLGQPEIDVMSMDLDGNDLYFINFFMHARILPKVIVTEYNAKFPPPIEFTVAYDPNHNFNSDYMGASIQSIDNLIGRNYKLVACNITGSNAFYVRNDFAAAFKDVPQNINEKFIPANYGIVTRVGHNVSPKTIERFINS